MKWEYKDYRPQGFESWSARWGNYELTVYQIGEKRYSIGWYYKGCRTIKEYVDANNWDEAKASAINIVKNYFNQMAKYWQDMQMNFTNWIVEEVK